MRLLSSRELAFRLKQELHNLSLLLTKPVPPFHAAWKPSFLPDPAPAVAVLRGTKLADEIVGLAEQIVSHRFPLLGLEIETEPSIRWRRDYTSGKETELQYFRRIPYLDFSRAGDHKVIWELNRHQHLVLLAQAYRLSGRLDFVREIAGQVDSWIADNPFQRGINWSSALEAGFRALSWIWVLHLAGDELGEDTRTRMLTGLYRHGLHVATNLSFYFSPNTHLLGEAVALEALGLFFGGLHGTETWAELGARIIVDQMERQVRPDGSHFEQSSYYHLYALDMFLFHAAISQPSGSYRVALTRMAEYLDALMGPRQTLPLIGDDDGGRFFHPFGSRKNFGRATLATCGIVLDRCDWIRDEADLFEQAIWWLDEGILERAGGTRQPRFHSKLFPDAGTAVMISGENSCLVDAGPFGPFRAGHSHADTLSLIARCGDSDLLTDPGTFTYADARWRDFFRATSAHNTIRLQGLDQAEPAGQFAWRNPPRTVIRQWTSTREMDYLDAECFYRTFHHRRRFSFLKPGLLFVLDQVRYAGDENEPLLAEQFWHAGAPVRRVPPHCFRIGSCGMLTLDGAGEEPVVQDGEGPGWTSSAFGAREAGPVIMKAQRGSKMLRFGAVLIFASPDAAYSLTLAPAGDTVEMILSGCRQETVLFTESGLPQHRRSGG